MTIFDLDSSKLNEIMYNMENQNKNSSIHIETGEILTEVGNTPENKLYPLPKWGPVDGFRIMNEFVSILKNPVVKGELKDVLNQGSGVFRKFKNTLKNSPEVEKIWYNFKKEEIKQKVLQWYNQIREYAGLSVFQEDDILFEEDEVVEFDFSIERADQSMFDFIKQGDKVGFFELYTKFPQDVIEDIYAQKREGILNIDMFNSDYLYVCKGPEGDLTGFFWAITYTLGQSYTGMELLQLFVAPEFRGLGIGKKLVNKLIQKYKKNSYTDLVVNCRESSSWLKKYLELEGFNIQSQELTFRL